MSFINDIDGGLNPPVQAGCIDEWWVCADEKDNPKVRPAVRLFSRSAPHLPRTTHIAWCQLHDGALKQVHHDVIFFKTCPSPIH